MFLAPAFPPNSVRRIRDLPLLPICSWPKIKTASESEDMFIRALKCKILKLTLINFIRDGINKRILVPHRVHKRFEE